MDDDPTTEEQLPAHLHHDALHERLSQLEHLADPRRAVRAAGHEIAPAWRRVTRGESRVAVSITMAAAIGLMLALCRGFAPLTQAVKRGEWNGSRAARPTLSGC